MAPLIDPSDQKGTYIGPLDRNISPKAKNSTKYSILTKISSKLKIFEKIKIFHAEKF